MNASVQVQSAPTMPTVKPVRRLTWEQAEGSPLPLGATWIEEEQAFNFAVHAEHAESVTLLLYASRDLVNPLLAYRFDFLRNKSGRIWHCRIPLSETGDARYYGYSVSGQAVSYIHSFDPQKVLLDPYAKCVFFPPEFDRHAAMREGSKCRQMPRWACCRPTIDLQLGGKLSAVSRVGRYHLRTSCKRLHAKSQLGSGTISCRNIRRTCRKNPLSKRAGDHGGRAHANFSA